MFHVLRRHGPSLSLEALGDYGYSEATIMSKQLPVIAASLLLAGCQMPPTSQSGEIVKPDTVLPARADQIARLSNVQTPKDPIYFQDPRGGWTIFPYKPGMTAVQVLRVVVGVPRPSSAKLYLRRGDNKWQRVDYRAVLRGDASKDRLLQPEDHVLFVSRHAPPSS